MQIFGSENVALIRLKLHQIPRPGRKEPIHKSLLSFYEFRILTKKGDLMIPLTFTVAHHSHTVKAQP